jgi:hypothetical protein
MSIQCDEISKADVGAGALTHPAKPRSALGGVAGYVSAAQWRALLACPDEGVRPTWSEQG